MDGVCTNCYAKLFLRLCSRVFNDSVVKASLDKTETLCAVHVNGLKSDGKKPENAAELAAFVPDIIGGVDSKYSAYSSAARLVVLDTSAFIRKLNFTQHGKDFYTVPEVLNEVLDRNSKDFCQNIFCNVKVQEPPPEALKTVTRFSRLTGDYSVLSLVDLKVLALAYFLEKCTHNGSVDHLRKYPPKTPLDASKGHSLENEGNDDAPSPAEADGQLGDHGLHKVGRSDQVGEYMMGFGEFDDEDEESGWINTNTISQCKNKSTGVEFTTESDPDVKVTIITLDYAMQNVLLQMGMHLTSVDGKSITKIQKWVRRCFSCSRICRSQSAQFCPECGYPTLLRVKCSIDNKGNVLIDNFPRINIRHTKFSIPNPRNKALILTQADIPDRKFAGSKKVHVDGGEFESVRTPSSQKIVIGYGRFGPSINKKSGRKKVH